MGALLGRGEAVPEVGWSLGRAEEGSPWRGRRGGGPAHRRRCSSVAGRRWPGRGASGGHEEGRGALDFGIVGAEGGVPRRAELGGHGDGGRRG